MKYFVVIVTFATISELVRGDLITNTARPNLRSMQNDPIRECEAKGSKEECDSVGSCDWFADQCLYRVVEGCDFITNDSDCNKDISCVWLSDTDPRNFRQDVSAYCASRSTVTDEDNNRDDRDCRLLKSEEVCNLSDGCDWFNGQCKKIFLEDCTFITENKDCSKDDNCVWMSDESDLRPDSSKGYCANRDAITDGGCVSPGHVIRSKETCNSVKGCSWFGGNLEACSVALTQLQCDGFQDQETCLEEGCEFKKIKKKKKGCVGRWENDFLTTLKKMDGIDAKQKIEDEYGDKYEAVLIFQGKGRQTPRKHNRTRIKLHLNKKGAVKKVPNFG